MPIVECGRAECIYYKKKFCTAARIAWRKGRCLTYVTLRDLKKLMRGPERGLRREDAERKHERKKGRQCTESTSASKTTR